MISYDDKIGSLKVKLGSLVNACGTKLALSPPSNGYILVRAAEFRGITGPASQSRVASVADQLIERTRSIKTQEPAVPPP
jgi:hypothetical protein